jgi:protein SCO1/2
MRALLLMLLVVMPVLASELPGDSLYQLPIMLADQNAHDFALRDRRGRPQLVSMFYTSCQYVCPLIIDTLRKTQRALEPAQRNRIDVLLVSFDPARDTPARLKQVFAERKLDAAHWTLARTDERSVRSLAAALKIQYRALANGDVNHSSALVLLDADGRIVARTDRIGETDPEFLASLVKLTSGAR